MKKILPYLVALLFVGVIVTIFVSLGKSQQMVVIKEGNTKRIPLDIALHKYQDSYCGMVIDDLTYASQVIAPDGKTWFFHDHGDFVLWLEDKPFAKEAKIWVMSRDTHKWIDAKKAFYTRTEDTPMGFGIGAYEHNGTNRIDFDTMRLHVVRGETIQDPRIKKMLLEQK